MPTLLLLRHAKSSWDDPQLSDHARPLNLRGRQAAKAMAEAMRRLALVPDVVLVSSARRTLQTLEALEPWDRLPAIEPLDALYLAPAGDLLDALQAVTPDTGTVLLIGHNPGLHDLALLLAGDGVIADAQLRRIADSFPSGALAEFDVEAAWTRLGPGRARLKRFLAPADLSEVDA